jgi:signal transduction histidine kinase
MSDGHGVKNCAVRLEKIGGCCQVESLPGTGTTVRIKIPVPCLTVSRIDDENTVMGYSSIENVNK